MKKKKKEKTYSHCKRCNVELSWREWLINGNFCAVCLPDRRNEMKRNVEYQSNYKSSTSDKINWLLKHQKMWEGYKLPDEWYRIESVAKQMKEEGLYSQTTYLLDIIHSVKKHIETARKVRRIK